MRRVGIRKGEDDGEEGRCEGEGVRGYAKEGKEGRRYYGGGKGGGVSETM